MTLCRLGADSSRRLEFSHEEEKRWNRYLGVCVCVRVGGREVVSEIYSDPPSAPGSGRDTVERDDGLRLVAVFDWLQVIGCFVFL